MKNKRKKKLWKQFKKYERRVSLTGLERRALREWVKSGRSIYDFPHRHPTAFAAHKQAFPDTYRKTCEIRCVDDEDTDLLRDCHAPQYPEPDSDFNTVNKQRSGLTHKKTQIRKRNRELFHLWEFIEQEGIWEEAKEYVEDMADTPTPFEEE